MTKNVAPSAQQQVTCLIVVFIERQNNSRRVLTTNSE